MDLSLLNKAMEAKTNAPLNATSFASAPINNAGQVFQPSPSSSTGPRLLMDNLKLSIKTERTLQGMTQRQLASKAGMSQGTITRAERHGWISFWCLLRIADALGKKVELT